MYRVTVHVVNVLLFPDLRFMIIDKYVWCGNGIMDSHCILKLLVCEYEYKCRLVGVQNIWGLLSHAVGKFCLVTEGRPRRVMIIKLYDCGMSSSFPKELSNIYMSTDEALPEIPTPLPWGD